MPSQTVVEVKNLSRNFGKVKAVNNISFSFVSSEVHGFIGPNGAGKTTTMRIISSLDVPEIGDVTVNGISVVDNPELTRRHVGFMPDYIESYTDMVVDEYLDFYGRAYKLKPKDKRRRLDDIIEFCNLNEMLDRPVHGLSKGMKQRLSLGRVLINDPAVLILDEPAAGLDPRARIDLRRLVRLLADRGKAVFISSHILSELSEICDSVTIIEQGKVQASSNVNELQQTLDQGTRVEAHLLTPTMEEKTRLSQLLTVQENIFNVEIVVSGVAFSYQGEVSRRSELLKLLVENDFVLTDFHAATSDLEDTFMKLTAGSVQ